MNNVAILYYIYSIYIIQYIARNVEGVAEKNCLLDTLHACTFRPMWGGAEVREGAKVWEGAGGGGAVGRRCSGAEVQWSGGAWGGGEGGRKCGMGRKCGRRRSCGESDRIDRQICTAFNIKMSFDCFILLELL